MKRWLLIPITALLVHSIVRGEIFSREVTFLPRILQLPKSDEPAFSAGELTIQGISKDIGEPEVINQVISLHSVPRSQAATALLGEANRQLNVMRISTYSHKTQVDEAKGQFRYDCSGFLKYALDNSVPEALRSLQKATVRRPLAKHFVRFITSIAPGEVVGRWKHIERVTDLAPGDIIAWLQPTAVDSDNTGHVMIVRDTIRQHPDRLKEIIIPVIDSSASSHGRNDSRYSSESSGLGTGSIVLVVDGANKAIGYRWSNSKKSRSHTTKVALARLE